MNDIFVTLLIYVDDILIANNDLPTVYYTISSLNKHFKLKDLGSIKYFLEMEVARSKKGISLCQRKYALELIFDDGLLASKLATFPVDTHCNLSKNDRDLLEDGTSY